MPVDDFGRLTDDHGVPLLGGKITWTCPNCWTQAITAAHIPNRYHHCPGLHGLTAPLFRAGTGPVKVEAALREDYQGRELTQDGDDGKPYMNVRATRGDGDDLIVLAPCAQIYG